jgi:hypothetical protein
MRRRERTLDLEITERKDDEMQKYLAAFGMLAAGVLCAATMATTGNAAGTAPSLVASWMQNDINNAARHDGSSIRVSSVRCTDEGARQYFCLGWFTTTLPAFTRAKGSWTVTLDYRHGVMNWTTPHLEGA